MVCSESYLLYIFIGKLMLPMLLVQSEHDDAPVTKPGRRKRGNSAISVNGEKSQAKRVRSETSKWILYCIFVSH